MDSVASHKKFEGKYGLPFILLSDTEKEVIQLCEKMQSRYENSYNRKTIYTDIERLKSYGMKIGQIKGKSFGHYVEKQERKVGGTDHRTGKTDQ